MRTETKGFCPCTTGMGAFSSLLTAAGRRRMARNGEFRPGNRRNRPEKALFRRKSGAGGKIPIQEMAQNVYQMWKMLALTTQHVVL